MKQYQIDAHPDRLRARRVAWVVGEHRRWAWAALCVSVAAFARTHVVVAVDIAGGGVAHIYMLSHLS